MRLLFQIPIIFGFFWLGYIHPFIVVFRGGALEATVKQFWALSVIYSFLVCLGIPAAGAAYSPELEKELVQIVPEARAIVGNMFGGFLAPLIAGTLGLEARSLAQTRFPKWVDRISYVCPKDNADALRRSTEEKRISNQ